MLVTSYLMGGLGNQLFQISKSISISKLNKLDSLFLLNSFILMEGNQPIKYKNNIFRNVRFVESLPKLTRVSETSFSYKDMNLTYEKPLEFYGYFQSSKNFLGYNNDIINMFSPTQDFKLKIFNKFPDLKKEKTISIHIRRGDYLDHSNIHPIIDKSYIDECLNQVGDYDKIYIFSNDKKWVKNNLNYKNSIVIEDLEDYEELWMISLCKINIMSNSTFSWWGSFLNNNKNKIVFCPSIWFGPKGEKNFQDIYENDWKKINVFFKDGKLIC